MTMSDRIVVMMEGVALQVASPKVVYEDPSDLRVARFVGSPAINVLPATVEAAGTVDVLGVRLPLQTGLAPGTHVEVAARAQALSLAARPGGPVVTGRVVHIENLGSDLFLHAAVEGVAALVVVRHDPGLANTPALGDPIGITLPAARVLLFDNAGRRIAVQTTPRHAHA
jgi:multiple sugar transport system ATP-binding protein